MMHVLKTRGWYWKVHGNEYQRFSVSELPQFCGWDIVTNLVNECDSSQYYEKCNLKTITPSEKNRMQKRLIERDKALVVASFESGGRILEVLGLRKEMFTIESDRIIIENMPVVKRWKKLREVVSKWAGEGEPNPKLKFHFLPQYGGWVKRKFITKPILDRRNKLEIPLSEPLTPYLVAWLDNVDDFLFSSYAKNSNPPMTTTRAYQIVRDLGERQGIKICPHWFRSMRASQLASEYNWREFELKRFFSWKSDAMASKYAKLSSTDLFDKMKTQRFGDLTEKQRK